MFRLTIPCLLPLALLLPGCQTTDETSAKPTREVIRLNLTLMEAFPPHNTAEFPVAGGVEPVRGRMMMVSGAELDESLRIVAGWGSELLNLPPLDAFSKDVGRSELMSPGNFGPAGEAPPREGIRWIAFPELKPDGAVSVRSEVRLTESLGLAAPHTPRPAGTRPEYKAHVIEAKVALEFQPGEVAVFCAGTSSEGNPVWGIMRAQHMIPKPKEE